ncbi:hypothetical protein OPKNFCMD_4007 [Methylobacterium crusticola]|uniref:Calcium-binding protein n=1 Tax=Methylobacterium crusticola TaxID=1697972 RepID=A0ABQ4R1D0_9HYPH|nr:hypothetical protein [Methylobacterium crusticola]GJD51254.1 hypothetical protein OPKNFCMD_4007 [Methylobacterium crusticola]
MENGSPLFWLAFVTFGIVFVVLIYQRVRVHRAKQTGERSTFTDTHGGEPRAQVGIGETQKKAEANPAATPS